MIEPLFAEILDAASRAPSAHNTQPWLLEWQECGLMIRVSPERCLPSIDPRNLEVYHGLGAMLENVLVALAYRGYQAEYELHSAGETTLPVVRVRWQKDATAAADETLYRMIPIRHTSRVAYRPEPLTASALAALKSATVAPCRLSVLTDATRIEEVRKLVAIATMRQFTDDKIVQELHAWMRFSPRDRRWYRDGLNSACMGMNRVEAAIARWLLAPATVRTLVSLGMHGALLGSVNQHAPQAPALCLLSLEEESPRNRLEAGRILERIWLTAAAHNLSTHPISAAIDVPETRARICEIFDVPASLPLVNLFRIGSSPAPTRSPRLPHDEIVLCKVRCDA